MHWLANLFSLWIKDFNARREGKDHWRQSSLPLAFCSASDRDEIVRWEREREREREREEKEDQTDTTIERERERDTQRERGERERDRQTQRERERERDRRQRDRQTHRKRERWQLHVWVSPPASARYHKQWRFEFRLKQYILPPLCWLI